MENLPLTRIIDYMTWAYLNKSKLQQAYYLTTVAVTAVRYTGWGVGLLASKASNMLNRQTGHSPREVKLQSCTDENDFELLEII
jgi:translation initiation factor IF-3